MPDLIFRLLNANPKVLVQDWWKDTVSQKRVKSSIEEVLDEDLPESYDRKLFREKCDNAFELVLEFAAHGKK